MQVPVKLDYIFLLRTTVIKCQFESISRMRRLYHENDRDECLGYSAMVKIKQFALWVFARKKISI